MKSRTSAERRKLTQQIGFLSLRIVAIIAVLPIIAIIAFIVYKGASAISWEFMTGFPSDGMRSGGIWPAIVGTFFLTMGCAILVAPVGHNIHSLVMTKLIKQKNTITKQEFGIFSFVPLRGIKGFKY